MISSQFHTTLLTRKFESRQCCWLPVAQNSHPV